MAAQVKIKEQRKPLAIQSKRLSFTLLANLVTEIFLKFIPLLMIHLGQRRLGLEAFGYAQFGIALIETVLPFIPAGYNNYGTVRLGQIRDDVTGIRRLISNMVALKLIHALVVLGMLVALTLVVPGYHPYTALVVILSFALLFSGTEMLWVQIGIQKYAWFGLFNAIGKLVSLALVVLFVHGPSDASAYAAFTLLATTVLNLGTTIYCLRLYPLLRPQWNEMRAIIRNSKAFALVSVLLVVYERVDILLVERMFDLTNVGLYGGPARIGHALNQIVAAIVLSFFAEMVVQHSRESLTKHLAVSVWTTLSFLSPIVFGAWFVGHEVLGLILGGEFYQQRDVLGMLLFGNLGSALMGIFGLQILQNRGAAQELLVALGGGIVATVVLIIGLGSRFGLIGVATAQVLGKGVAVAVMVYYGRRFVDYLPWRECVGALLPGAVMAACLLLLPDFGVFATVGIGGLIFVPVFALCNRQRLHKLVIRVIRSRRRLP